MKGAHGGPKASAPAVAADGTRQHHSLPKRPRAYRCYNRSIQDHPVLGFCMEHQDDLGTGIHPFGLGHHSSAARKMTKARDDQHQFIAGGGAAPALDGFSLLATMAMSCGAHAGMRVVLVTLLGKDHPTALAMQDINAELLERETELE